MHGPDVMAFEGMTGRVRILGFGIRLKSGLEKVRMESSMQETFFVLYMSAMREKIKKWTHKEMKTNPYSIRLGPDSFFFIIAG